MRSIVVAAGFLIACNTNDAPPNATPVAPEAPSAETTEKVTATFPTPAGDSTDQFSIENAEPENPNIKVNDAEADIDLDAWEASVTKSGSMKAATAGTGTRNFTILKLDGIPQYKTEYKIKTIARVFRKKIKTKVPVAFRRYATKTMFASVTYPQAFEAQVVTDVEQCGAAASVGAVAGAIKGGPGAALVAFNVSFQACIIGKQGDRARQIQTTVDFRTDHTAWTPY